MLEDVYFDQDYIELYLNDDGCYLDFSYNENESLFSSRTIKRKILKIGDLQTTGRNLYDAETAYGYGGYRTNSLDPQFVSRALEKYRRYCAEKNVVAEFVRFLPFNDFPQRYPEHLDFLIPDRQTVYVDLKLEKEGRWAQYDANTRNILRKAEKTLTFERTKDIGAFIEMYDQTMKRNQAEGFYFFDDKYFQRLSDLEHCHLYQVKLGQEIICGAFMLLGKEIAHYHLSASRTEFLKYNGNYFLLDNLFEEARKAGKTYFHLGGGRTNLERDSLLQFKKKFSKRYLTFYIAGKIFMPDIYRELCDLWQRQTDSQQNYFLKYRLPLKS